MFVSLLGLVVAFVLLGLGNTVGYHRLLTHRALRCVPPVRWALVFLGACHGGPPLFWVGLHRLHHLESDHTGDPHSPRDGGFWFAHTGWLLGVRGGPTGAPLAILFALSGFGQQVRTFVHDVRRVVGGDTPWLALCQDFADDRFTTFLDRPFVTTALFGGQLALAASFGWGGIAWLWALHLLLTNASWSVNSVCHTPRFGAATYVTGDDARDVGWLAPFTLGEAWHNSHHRYPKSAWHSLGRGLDPSWWAIRTLVALRLASDPWLPREVRK